MAEYVEHLAQLKVLKDKKKEESKRERMERLKRTCRPWGASRVDELFPSQDRLQRKKAEKVEMIKAHIGSLLYDWMECQQPPQPPLRKVLQQVTSSLSKVETDSQSDVSGPSRESSPSSLSNESPPETDFIMIYTRSRTPHRNITAVKIWKKAGTGRERQLC